jgi:hypothetical protein
VTVPLVVGTLMEQAAPARHTITADLANSCSKDGEDSTVADVKIDVARLS